MAVTESGLTLSYASHGGGLHHQRPEDILYTLKVEQSHLDCQRILISYPEVFYIARILYALAITSIKISILLLYLRIFPGPWIRRAVKSTIILTLTGNTVLLLLWLFKCRPISHAWKIQSHGSCISKGYLFQSNAIFSLLINLIIIALPMSIIWRLVGELFLSIYTPIWSHITSYVRAVTALKTYFLPLVFVHKANADCDII